MALCGLRDVTLVSADILVETPYGLIGVSRCCSS